MSSPEAWQQEKEFLDYMFVSLHHPAGTTTATALATSTSASAIASTSLVSMTGEGIGTGTGVEQGAVSSGTASGNGNSRTGSGRRSGLSSNKSPVLKDAPAGLDHLDHLCRLMEQLGELRDANSRLQKRVQYLEDMKTLQEMHQELDIFVDEPSQSGQQADRSLDSLDSSGELLQSPPQLMMSIETSEKRSDRLSSSSKKERKGHSNHHHHHRFKKPLLLKQRERSKSVGFDEIVIGEGDGDKNNTDQVMNQQQQQSQHKQRSIKTKVSKWTRVKEAFRWEKAHVSKQAEVLLKEAPVSARVAVHLAGIDSPAHHHAVVIKSASPVFRLGRRRRSTSAGTRTPNSSSSSSLSECPLESEILKSFADAQELPILRLENEKLSAELKRLNRQSTISCDANFAAVSPAPSTSPIHSQEAGKSPAMSSSTVLVDQSVVQANVKSNAKEQRKMSSKPAVVAGLASVTSDQQQPEQQVQHTPASTAAETDESGSFISNLRSQLKPINEWTAKWHCDLMKINNTNTTPPPNGSASSPAPTGVGGGHQSDAFVNSCSRNSLSVPSTPNQHQAFTFDVYPEAGLEHGTASRENSPGSLKSKQLDQPSSVVFDGSISPLSDAEPKSPRFSQSNARPVAEQLLTNISPEFRKKVEVWERLKSGLTPSNQGQQQQLLEQQPTAVTPPTPHSGGSGSGTKNSKTMDSPDWGDVSKRRSETSDKLPPAFKKKLAEWEIRKAVAGKSDREVEELQKILPQDFNRKLQEWERMKQAAAAGKSIPSTSSPGLERQGSAGKRHQQPQQQQNRAPLVKAAKTVHKMEGPDQQHCEKQKEKELQWLEKELQKIEREKLRLEREREKYIERESRLEKIREAMRQPGHGPQREICIKTSTGEFRFQGLSRKFTKKLFQWEEQKGIRPEASTIALLDGAYRPPGLGQQHGPSSSLAQSPLDRHQSSGVGGGGGGSPLVGTSRPTSLALGRSKSESSVADLVSTSVHSQPSSLSLNEAVPTLDDVDELGAQALPAGPGALLVEVEDVVEESAAMMDILDVQPQSAVYSIAPSELRQTAQFSEQMEGEPRLRHHAGVERNDSVRTEASYKLLEENLTLIDRLRAKGEIVKYLELQMNSIDGDMAGVVSTQTEELVRLKREQEHTGSCQQEGSKTGNNSSTIDRLRQRVVLLETRGQQLKSEKEQLQMVYHRQCSQQVQLVQHLVDKMQQLRDTAIAPQPPLDPEALQRLDTLTSELLHEAQELESSIRQPQRMAAEKAAIKSAVVAIPEQLSAKANKLKEEFERLRSFDSDLEDAESDDETATEVVLTPKLLIPAPVPEQLEMSSAAAKKIFVETRRLVFAPVDNPPVVSPQQSEQQLPAVPCFQSVESPEEEECVAPWRRVSRTSTRDGSNSDCSASCRKNSGSTSTLDGNPTATVRATAPNIRRMIDMYHQRVTGVRERPNLTLNLRSVKCDSPVSGIMTRSPSSSPSPPGIVVKAPTPQPGDGPVHHFVDRQSNHFNFLQPIGLCKSQSTGAMEGTDQSQRLINQPQQHLQHPSVSGVLRSRSGHQIPSSSSGSRMEMIGLAPCARNPSFFRKSPLDPSIDDLLQKYRGRGRRSIQAPLPPELPRSPTAANPERAIKLKQAREAFLTIGPGAIAQLSDGSSKSENQSPQASPVAPSEHPDKCESTKAEKSQLTVLSGSCPPSPTTHRPPPTSGPPRNATNPGRRSWLRQPAAFFFSRTPKTP